MIDVVNHFSYSLLNEITTNKETLEFPKLIPTLAVLERCIDQSNLFNKNLRPDENSLRYHDHDIHKEVKKQACGPASFGTKIYYAIFQKIRSKCSSLFFLLYSYTSRNCDGDQRLT